MWANNEVSGVKHALAHKVPNESKSTLFAIIEAINAIVNQLSAKVRHPSIIVKSGHKFHG
jgi:hypothetical protein